MSVTSASARTFRSLQRHRNFRLYFAGQSISISGTWVQNIAQAWLIVELTHSPVGSPLALGALAAFQFLPYTVLGLARRPAGGPLRQADDDRRHPEHPDAERRGARRPLADRAGDGVGGLPPGRGRGRGAGRRHARLASPSSSRWWGAKELPNAVSLNASLFNLARAAGPAVAGVLIATVGVTLCFAINAASFLAVIASLLLMRTTELFTTRAGRGAQGVLQQPR